MATHKLEDLDVEGVIAFLSSINLDRILGDEFKDQQIDGELLVDGAYY